MLETDRLLRALIKGMGYKIEVIWRHPTTWMPCDPPQFNGKKRSYAPQVDYVVTKILPEN